MNELDSNSPNARPIRVLITAGPTHEPIDAVRYIANRSSGQMGLALAAASAAREWPTTLLLGPTHLNPPNDSKLRVERFRTTADLQSLLTSHFQQCDVLIMAAAVADYRPATASDSKLTRSAIGLTLQLEPTPDLLAELATRAAPHQLLVGFALEPADRLLASAESKLGKKGVDFIVANPLETMNAANVSATLIGGDGSREATPSAIPKPEFALWLLARLEPAIRHRMTLR